MATAGAKLDLQSSRSPTHDQIQAQIKRMFQSNEFSSARIRRLLVYIVDQTLSGNEKGLKQYAIATDVLGRDDSFDPNVDPVVRLEAGRLRRCIENYYLRMGSQDEVRISIPKGAYAASFQLSTELLNPEPHPPSGPAAGSDPAAVTLDPQRLHISKLWSRSDDSGIVEFADGMRDQLIVEFTRYPDIFITCSPEMEDRDEQSLVQGALGGRQTSRFVLYGNVKYIAEHMRVTMRLHDLQTGSIIWTERFDADPDHGRLLNAQDQIARQVAGSIAGEFGILAYRLGIETASKSSSPWSVRDAVFHHRNMARSLTEAAYHLTRECIELGIKQVPHEPTLWAARAHVMFYGNVLGYDQHPEWLALVRRYTQRALELDHRNHYAHVVMAQCHLYRRDLDEAFETSRLLLEGNPHSPSKRLSAGYFRALAGDWAEGIGMVAEALRMLPHPPGWAYKAIFLHHYRERRYREALHEIDKYAVPDHFTPQLLRAAVLVRLGRGREADIAAAEVRRVAPRFREIADDYFRYLVAFDDIAEDLAQPLRKVSLL